jgi:CRP-like cAMP-binding protein
MLHDATQLSLFPRLPPDAVQQLHKHGAEVQLNAGDVLFREGKTDYHFWVVLEGEVRITKRVGNEDTLLTIHGPGEFTGEISILTGAPAIAAGRALGSCRVLRIDAATFKRIMAENSPLAKIILSAMVGRTQDVEAQFRQQEKLAALGKLSAGLAHELNNPAAAARRAATSLRDQITQNQARALAHDEHFTARRHYQGALRAGQHALRGTLADRPSDNRMIHQHVRAARYARRTHRRCITQHVQCNIAGRT